MAVIRFGLNEQRLREFFEKIDLSRPELTLVRESVEREDLSRAKSIICEHFRMREKPHYLYDVSDLVGIRFPHIVEEAEKVCNHYLFCHNLGENIDWYVNPLADPEWLWSLHRVPYWVTLGRAYRQTKDERYSAEFARLFLDWYEKTPVSEFMSKPYVEIRRNWPPVWRVIETAIRLYTAFLPCLLLFKDSQNLTDDVFLQILTSIWEHAEYLHTHFSARRATLNFMMMECAGLWQAGVMFPEFEMSETWKKEALERLANELPAQVYPDGGQKEITPVYHLVCTITSMQNYILAERNNIELPKVIPETVEKMLEWLSLMVRPDWTLPMLGDADLDNLAKEKADSALHEGMNITNDLLDLNDLRSAFRMGAELFRREDFLWFSTLGKKGRPPSKLSVMLPDSGLYIMRSGWSETDGYALLACPKMERVDAAMHHRHGDALHFEMCACGETLLTDSGRYCYMRTELVSPGAFQKPFSATRMHNTVVVDGVEQIEWSKDPLCPLLFPNSICNRWYTSESLDWVDVAHDGYQRLHNPVTHRRRVAFIKPHYWVVEDILDGKGEHDFELFWHFVPGDVTVESDKTAVFRKASKVKLIVNCLEDPVGVEVIRGQTEPLQGWVSFGYGHKEPAPVLRTARKAAVPTRFVTVLLPFRGKDRPTIRENAGKLLTFEVDRGSGVIDTLIVPRRDVAAEELEKLGFDGDFAFIRKDQNGRVIHATVVGGTKVRWDDSLLLGSKAKMGVVQLEYENETVLVTSSEPLDELQVNLLEAKEIVMNGAPIKAEIKGGIASVRLT